MKSGFMLIALGASLGACVPAASQPPSRAAPRPARIAQPVAPAVSRPPPPADEEDSPGDRVIGRNARALIARFGTPGLDVREGSARKLQFLGSSCVLDVYLYPRREGDEPVATHVDARLPDGRDTDREPCVEALSRR